MSRTSKICKGEGCSKRNNCARAALFDLPFRDENEEELSECDFKPIIENQQLELFL